MRSLTRLTAILFVVSAVALATTISTPTQAVPSNYFGMHFKAAGTSAAWPTIPYGSLRVWNNGVRWSTIETSQNAYKWSRLDAIVSQAQSHGKEIVYTFGGTPTWASTNPSNTSCSFEHGSCNAPRNIYDWEDFVRALATRYKGRIHYYELWNEPNDTHYWQNDIPTLEHMAMRAYNIIKSIDPAAKVLTPAPTWATTSQYAWFDQYFAAGGQNYADIISMHSYPGHSAPESATSLLANVKKVVAKYGQTAKPIWVSEGGWGPNSYVPDYQAQARFLARYLVLEWANGVKRFHWYAYDETLWGTLWQSSTGERPAANAYRQVYSWLVGATMTGCNVYSDNTYVCSLTRANGYSGAIVWNPTTSKTFSLGATYSRTKSLTGATTSLYNSTVWVTSTPILVER